MKNMGNRIKIFFKRLIKNINKPEMRVLPGQLSFFFFLTLIPLIALMGTIISLFDLPYNSIPDLLNEYFPSGTANILMVISDKVNINFNIIIFFISAILLSSNGTHSMIIASNQIYKISDKNYIKRRFKALLMVLVVIILLTFVLFIPVFGDLIFKTIALVDDTSIIKNLILIAYKLLKYPLSILFIYYLIKVLYIMAPDKKIQRQNVVYGALFSSVSWVLLTMVYSLYIEYFTSYDTFYGGISSILILMLWLYLISYIFVLGMALNVTKYELKQEDE